MKWQQNNLIPILWTVRVLNRNGPFICDNCGSEFSNRYSFQVHNHKKHVGVRRYCDLCPRFFRRKFLIIQHMMSEHMHFSPFECKVCGHKSHSGVNYKKHMLRHGPKTECNICHKFVTNMYNHLQSHAKVECHVCRKCFSKNNLKKHVRIHAQPWLLI